MNELKVFSHNEFGGIRAFEKDDQSWFVGKDVAGIIGYDEPHKAVVRFVEKEDRTKYPILSQETWVINESGLYSLILSSNGVISVLTQTYIKHGGQEILIKNNREPLVCSLTKETVKSITGRDWVLSLF